MSDQAEKANKFAREKLGAKADAAAEAASFTVLDGPGGGGGDGGKPEAKQPSWIKLPTLKWRLSQMAQMAGQRMATEEMFLREGVPVLVDPVTGQMQGVTAQKLRTELEQWIVFYKAKAGEDADGDPKEMKIPVTMQVDVARGLLEASEFTNRLRPLERVNRVRMPVMRADGRVELLPEGYDEESGIYTLKSGMKIDEAMTLEKAQAVMKHYHREFPFEDPRSLSVQITAMVALFGTCMLPKEVARMGFLWRSNDRGGGKSLLAEMAIAAPFGLPSTTDIRDRNKLAEALDSAALQSDPYLFFDNLEGTVRNTMIDNFITAPARRVRLFHTQKTVEAVAGTTLLFTGNNLEVSPDIDRRTLLCRLFVPEFDLVERKLENAINVHRLLQPAARAEILGALWALVRNWVEKGRPPASTANNANFRRPSFEEWSETFGGIVQAAGYGNPLVLPADDKAASPERVHQRRLVEVLALKIPKEGPKRVVVRDFQEIVDICYSEELFSDRLLDGGKIVTAGADGDYRDEFRASQAALAWLGRFMALNVCGRESGREYILPPLEGQTKARKVKIGFTGRGKHRNYWLEQVG